MSGDLKIRKLRLRNWENFTDVEVDIEDRVFLVGPNASGKSNFLDVFRFLCDLASSGGGFQEAVGRRGGVSALRCLAARRNPDPAQGVARVFRNEQDRCPDIMRLATALSAVYPQGCNEKRLLDAKLLAVPR